MAEPWIDMNAERPGTKERLDVRKQMAQLVLIVDDEPAILRLLSITLRGSGYEVYTATDAETALEILKAIKPRVIISDIKLPGIDGLELAEKVHSDDSLDGTRILLMSAYGEPRSSTGDHFIGKPFDIDELLDIVDRLSQVE